MSKTDYLWIGFVIGGIVYGWLLPWIEKKISERQKESDT